MSTTKKAKYLLKQMANIDRMERGKLCKMTSRKHFNHQTWESGRNVVRYVNSQQAPELQEAIDGYQRFMKLAALYADEIIKATRRKRKSTSKPPSRKKSTNKTPN